MAKKILLKNGQIVSSAEVFSGDVFVEGGKIKKVFRGGVRGGVRGDVRGGVAGAEGAVEIDCTGKLILPGLIDVHVHFREPGQTYKEDFYTGSMAAVCGGVTTVFDMPNNQPPIFTAKDLDAKRKLIVGKSYVNYGLYIGYNGRNIDEINAADGVCGVKIYSANSTGNMGVQDLETAFRQIKRDKLLAFHAEDEECIGEHYKKVLGSVALEKNFNGEIPAFVHSKIRAEECAVKMVSKICELARKYERPIHICHVSTEEELEVISKYRNVGIRPPQAGSRYLSSNPASRGRLGVTCEVAPHHLVLSEDDYGYLGNFIKVNPPIRSREEVFGLWKCLKSGLIDIIATDHAPHTKDEKNLPYLKAPSGVPGVEMMLPILLNTVNNGGLTIQEVVNLCCERPAEIFKVSKKGKILAGYDADLVVADMDLEKEFTEDDVVSKCGWSPYTGSSFQGWPVMTIVNGEIVFRDGRVACKAGGVEVGF